MSIPSKKTIENRLGNILRHEYGNDIKPQINQIRKALESAIDHRSIDNCLDICNGILKGYGVGSIRDNDFYDYGDIGLLYVNMGDSYIPTIIYDIRQNKFYICSWSDIVESDYERFNI